MAEEGISRVLIIEDDDDTRANIADILELDGFQCSSAATLGDGLRQLREDEYFAIVLDRKLPDGHATESLPKIRKLAAKSVIIVVTGYADLDGAIVALREGASDYILKPINADALCASLARIRENRKAADEIARLSRSLERREAELKTILDIFPAEFAVAMADDPSCEFIHVNASFARLLGIPPGTNAALNADPGSPKYRVFSAGRELTPAEMPLPRAAQQGLFVRDVELEIERADGSRVTMIGHAAPLFDEHGKTRGAIGAFLDVTERKRAEERARRAERLAAIGETMAALVHESRNALQRSKACLEMLAEEVHDRPDALDLVHRTQRAQERLAQLYEEVRQYAAPIRLVTDRHDLKSIWREAWEHLAHSHQDKRLRLVEIDGEACGHCDVDRVRISQVMLKILDNAIQASSAGGEIRVGCSHAELAGVPMLEVAICDQGPGLTPEQRQRIFEPFFTTKAKGTGLGMAIVQRIVLAHGGQVRIGEQTGKGAQIIVALPRGQS
jgi:signal transduction histidine kinase/ActR/RegA family two-component response regulator